MHQHPRPPPKSASPASSPATNPLRTNNPRDPEVGPSRSDSGRGTPVEQGIGIRETLDEGVRNDDLAKLNQVIQSYFTKATLIILQSRIALPPAYARGSETKRTNKWFNIELDETDALREDLRTWKSCDALDPRPPPLIIETYIDFEDIATNQCLAILDESGKRWDVENALRRAAGSTAARGQKRSKKQIILERWHLELKEGLKDLTKDLGTILPRVYKNSIVLFRSLYTYAKLLPAWNLGRRNPRAKSSLNLPKLKYRVVQSPSLNATSDTDPLALSLYNGHDRVVEDYAFSPIDSPAGPFSIRVTYRTNCGFQIDNSEALLSSHFMGMDEDLFRPSLGGRDTSEASRPIDSSSRQTHIGSLPQARRPSERLSYQGQAYGSMSTFHKEGSRMGSSPISALRAAGEMMPQSPTESPQAKPPPLDQRSSQSSRSSLRSGEAMAPPMGRRTSVSFQPFKTPSLSASPSQGDPQPPTSPRGSINKNSPLSAILDARHPAGAPPASRPTSIPSEPPVPSLSSSPRPPQQRYSSSFSNRRTRLSVGGTSKTEEDGTSSGKASVSSSNAQPGSGTLATEGGGASSGSMHTDDDNISDFLKLLDQKKELTSFQASKYGERALDASARRTTAALSKFQRMRDSHAALSDSISASGMLHRSSSSSSRQLSSVPPMVAGTSMSISSSPGKPISPHTPHTPAIPSRLSANSIAEYSHRERITSGRHGLSRGEGAPADEEPETDVLVHGPGTTGAIDIPTSPRPYHPGYRRSSSVAQGRNIPLPEDEPDPLPFGRRSTSLGGNGEERPTLSLSALLALQEDADVGRPRSREPGARRYDAPSSPPSAPTMQRQASRDSEADSRPTSSRGASYRPRVGRGGGKGVTPPLAERGSGSGSSDQRGGRNSFSRGGAFEDEEPLLFAMSDFGVAGAGRRSVEEGRGGPAGGGGGERGGGDSGVSLRGQRRRGY